MPTRPGRRAHGIALCLAGAGLALPHGARAQRARRPGGEASAAPAPLERAPRIVRVVEAVYPPEALRRGESAEVVLQIDLDDAGHVTTVAVANSSGQAGFDDAAVAAAREFEFEPARRGDRAVAARIRYRYRFTPPAPRATDEDAPRPGASTSSVTPPTPVASTPSVAGAPTTPAPTAPTAPTEPVQGVTVYARAPSREIGRREVTAEEIRRIPGARGDALLALQNLPGVARPAFGLGQFIVRSSPPDDSLVTLEGQPIALPFHFGGLASTIATDLIERIEFLPGNFSARYGRVAGGVINVTLRAPRRDKPYLVGDLDPIDIGAYGSVPVGRHASVGVGVRRSFIDLVGPPVFSLIGGLIGNTGTSFTQWPAYYDGQLVFDWDIGPRDSLRVVASATDDQLLLNFTDPNANDPNVRGSFGTHLAYAGVQTRWRHRFSPDVIHTFAPAISYNYSSAGLGPEVNFTFRSVVFNFRDELELRLSRAARVFLGVDFQCGTLDNDVRAPPLPTNGIQDPIDPSTVVTYRARRPFCGGGSMPTEQDRQRAVLNPGVYAEAEIDAGPAVRFLAGVRTDYFGLLDALVVQPRAQARIQVHPRAVVRAGLGIYNSPPRGNFIVPGFGNPNLGPERWTHATVGATLDVIPGIMDFDTNLFGKFGERVVSPSTNTLPDGTAERFANTGQGRVIGAEWMLRARPGLRAPVYGMISYTLQRAVRARCPECAMTTYTYDQPHILSAILGAILPQGWEAGVRVRYTSGSVTPLVTGAIFDADHDVALTLTDPLRPGRLPDYFTVDWRVAKRFRWGPLRCQGILEVLNTFYNVNAESVIYSYDRRASQYITGLPIIPSLGIRAEY